MEIDAIRRVVEDNPQGVRIVMIDGTKFDVPHRDYIALGPGVDAGLSARKAASRTTFVLYEIMGEPFRLLNAMLVKEVLPLRRNGGSKKRRKSA